MEGFLAHKYFVDDFFIKRYPFDEDSNPIKIDSGGKR